jgi:hypothetical protein
MPILCQRNNFYLESVWCHSSNSYMPYRMLSFWTSFTVLNRTLGLLLECHLICESGNKESLCYWYSNTGILRLAIFWTNCCVFEVFLYRQRNSTSISSNNRPRHVLSMYGDSEHTRVQKVVEGSLGFDPPSSDWSRAWTPLMRSGSTFANYYRRAPEYSSMGCPQRFYTPRLKVR